MDLSFQAALADPYRSVSQKIKNLSEHWVSQQVYCPNCGQPYISCYGNNRPVADFYCSHCREDYELKSQARIFGPRVVDGAYRTMMERLKGSRNPNLFLMHYDPKGLSVRNLLVIPKYFFVPEVIEERRPLSPMARRAGWIGCYISLLGIPHAGRIFLIRNGVVEQQSEVLAKWQKILFLREQKDVRAKGWLLSVMRCIEKMGKSTFTLEEMYRFEGVLRETYPSNRHIKEKIRQKLQVLRDKGYLEFLGRGVYQLVGANPK
jgi:type II restriction enzyme